MCASLSMEACVCSEICLGTGLLIFLSVCLVSAGIARLGLNHELDVAIEVAIAQQDLRAEDELLRRDRNAEVGPLAVLSKPVSKRIFSLSLRVRAFDAALSGRRSWN